jgi:hypothetical protein
MKEEELIKKLRSVDLPHIELESHRNLLKMALLNNDFFKKKREVGIMELVKSRASGVADTIMGGLVTQRPVWRVALASILAMVIVTAAFLVGPSLGPQKASPFPDGSMEVGGVQLTAEQKEVALSILMADPGIQELLGRGAIIEPKLILRLEVSMSRINNETGEIEEVSETWAQAWIQLDNQQLGVQVDLVRGKVVSISE